MKDKNLGAPINQDEIYHYLKDIRKIKVMTPDREKELAVKMKSEDLPEKERKKIEEELLEGNDKNFSSNILPLCSNSFFALCKSWTILTGNLIVLALSFND